MMYAVLCYNNEEMVCGWSREQDDAVMAALSKVHDKWESAGKLKPLAVLSKKRSPALPNVPTIEEAGLKDMTFGSWAGLLAPAGTPPAIVQRLNAEVLKILAQPEVREQLAKFDYEPVGSTPEQFAKVIGEDAERWARLVKERNFKAAN